MSCAADALNSIVLRALLHPHPEYCYLMVIEPVAAVRHADRGIRAALDQHVQGAGERVPGYHERTELAALHHGFVTAHVEAARVVTKPTRHVALKAVLLENRLDVRTETYVPRRARAQHDQAGKYRPAVTDVPDH